MRELNTLTVGQLRELLESFEDDMPVLIRYPSGDYWQTELAGEVGAAESGTVRWTEYHRGWQAEEFDSEAEEPDGERRCTAVLLG